jgi:predicted outer membrane repeat protein
MPAVLRHPAAGPAALHSADVVSAVRALRALHHMPHATCHQHLPTPQASGNSADYGGAFYLDTLSRTLIMSGSILTGNQALKQGGAMFAAKDATLSLRDSFVDNNTANNDGGAIACVDCQEVYLFNTTANGGCACGVALL